MLHLLLHFTVPALVALLARRWPWWQAYALLMAGMLVDVDHLLADPVYAPLRCSMGFHPLHTWPAVLLYGALACGGRTRVVAVGLLLHMLLDTLDCLGMPGGNAALADFFRWPAWTP
jgi:hypothetical protein